MIERTDEAFAVRCLKFLRARSPWWWICAAMTTLGLVGGIGAGIDERDSALSIAGTAIVGAITFGGPLMLVGWLVRRTWRGLLNQRRAWMDRRHQPTAPHSAMPPPPFRPPPGSVGPPREPPGEPLPRPMSARARVNPTVVVLGVDDLHRWLREGVRVRWEGPNYLDTLTWIGPALSARVQRKIGTSEKGDRQLLLDVFSDKDPRAGEARLRFPNEPNEDSRRSRLAGARALGEACYAGVRNMVMHRADLEWSRQQVLAYLVMFSVLASWIDEASVERAKTPMGR